MINRALSVLLIGQFPPPIHGLAQVNIALKGMFERQGFNVRSINTAPGSTGLAYIRGIVRIVRVLLAMFFIFREIFLVRPKVLYFSGEAGSGNILLFPMFIMARILGLPTFLHHHNFSYINDYYWAMAWIVKISGSTCTHIFLCEDMELLFRGKYKCFAPSHCLSNAAFVEMGSHQYSDRPVGERLRIGMLSNLTLEKGVDVFLRVVDSISKKGVGISAILAGPAVDAQVLSEIHSLEREMPVEFKWLGPIYGDQKKAFYDSVDVFVFPTRYVREAQPMVLFEALSFGCALVSTNIGCISCDHADSPGLILPVQGFEEGSIDWLAQLGENPGEVSFLVSQSYERFTQLKIDADLSLERLFDLLEKSESGCSRP